MITFTLLFQHKSMHRFHRITLTWVPGFSRRAAIFSADKKWLRINSNFSPTATNSDCQLVDIWLNDDYFSAWSENSPELRNSLTLIENMVKGVNHDNSIKRTGRKRKMLRRGTSCCQVLGSSIAQHPTRNIHNYYFLDHFSQSLADPSGPTACV